MATKAQNEWNHREWEPPAPNQPTMFERLVAKLGLNSTEEIVASRALRQWVKQHKNSRYVPEELLKKWNMEADVSFGWQAGRGRL